ncbi:MAG: hypothetical protein WEB57_12350 [Pseudohongiellaceae bacterium]
MPKTIIPIFSKTYIELTFALALDNQHIHHDMAYLTNPDRLPYGTFSRILRD